MIPNEMKSWREVMDDVARLTKERDEALAEIQRMREIESDDLRAARDDAIRLGKERDDARAEVERWSERFAEQQKALAAAGLAGQTPANGIAILAQQRDEAREEVSQLHMRAASWPGYDIEAAKAEIASLRAEVERLRERAEEAERERDKVTSQLNNERADHVRIAVAAGVFYESDYSGPVRGPVDAVVKEIEALVKDRTAADRLRSLDQAVLAYRRKERALLGLPDEAMEEDHLQAIADLKSKVTLLNTKLADKRRVLLHETEMVATREEVEGAKAAKAEVTRLRAAAMKISQALAVNELTWDQGEDWFDHRLEMLATFGLAEELRAALRAEQAAAPALLTPSITPSPMDTASTSIWREVYAQATKEPAPAPVTPPADAPNDPTKNVCAIRRRSDGYWWECNSEHGAGWNDKRIRQAWTHRAAHAEVARMKASGIRDDVEVVELAPKPEPDAPQRPSVEELRKARDGLSDNYWFENDEMDRMHDAVRLLLDDAIAARGGAK